MVSDCPVDVVFGRQQHRQLEMGLGVLPVAELEGFLDRLPGLDDLALLPELSASSPRMMRTAPKRTIDCHSA